MAKLVEKKMPRPKKVPQGYKFQKFADNQDMFRTYHFQHFCRDWSAWKPLKKPLFTYLKEPGAQGRIKLNAREQDLVMKLLKKRCSSRDLKIIEDNVKKTGKAYAMNEAMFVEVRKAYQIAYDRAYKEFRKSKFRYPWEFWAIRYGLIKTKEFTHQGETVPR